MSPFNWLNKNVSTSVTTDSRFPLLSTTGCRSIDTALTTLEASERTTLMRSQCRRVTWCRSNLMSFHPNKCCNDSYSAINQYIVSEARSRGMRERTLQPAHLDASESDLAEQSVPELVALLYHLALLEFEIRILGLESVELLQNAVVVERVNLELLPVIGSESVKRRGNGRREKTYDCSTTAL
jgi:hypothetical protein